MIGCKVQELETPCLLVNLDKMEHNLKLMQQMADHYGVKLRPHLKSHKMGAIAKKQLEYGAQGVTVAKVSEAEAMADEGITDIFIATEVIGPHQLKRLRKLAEKTKICIAVDSLEHVQGINRIFSNDGRFSIELMIEINTGLNRCGVNPGDEAVELISQIVRNFPEIPIKGIFTHEGMAYNAENQEELKDISLKAQAEMIRTKKMIEEKFMFPCYVSIGCSLAVLGSIILPEIDEIRPGTYVFFDVQHANYVGHLDFCAATILTMITSKRGNERVVADAGAKSFTIDQRAIGMCKTEGLGKVKGKPELFISKLSDEHAIITPGNTLEIGDIIEIIPNHICPTVNLYNQAYGIINGVVETILTVNARGCTR